MKKLRIKKIKVANFKAFKTAPDIDLDADLVLLVGANGNGKTSLIEAIEVALTGGYRPRLGAPKDYKVEDLVNRHCRREGATIVLSWSDGTQDTVTINRKVIEGGFCGRTGQFLDSDERRVLRATTFMYGDAPGGILGLEEEVRKQILDMFLAKTPRIQKLSVTGANQLSAALQTAKTRLESGHVSPEYYRNLCLDEAKKIEASWERTGHEPPKLIKAGGDGLLSTALKNLVDSVRKAGGRDLPLAGAPNEVLSAVSADARKLAEPAESEISKASANIPGSEDNSDALRVAIAGIADDEIPAKEALLKHLATIETAEQIDVQLERRNRDLGAAKTHLQVLMSSDEHILRDDLPSIRLGAIPLLASLEKLHETPGLPAPVADFTGAASLKDVKKALGDLINDWDETAETVRSTQSEINRLNEAKRTRARIEDQLSVVDKLSQAWTEAFRGEPLPGNIETISMLLVRERLSSTAKTRMRSIVDKVDKFEDKVKAWHDVAFACDTWAHAAEQLEEAQLALSRDAERQQARQALQQIEAYVNSMNARTGGFFDQLRTKLVEAAYKKPLNDAMRQVLHCFGHHPEFRRTAQVFFDGAALRVRVESSEPGSDKRQISGLTSLSSSQFGALAFSVNIAAHLGNPELPVGFICLDDVTNAFDVNNLAADAAVLRKLAYGNGDTRRQIILTSHDEAVTDRLVPLLLPPGGKNMRIIEFLNWSENDGVRLEEYVVEGETAEATSGNSPLKNILRPVD